ncbi:MAG: Uma2 family endonuclease [Dehalococcoidia bacterium]
MATKTRLTLEEFLALPETKPPSEYIVGEVRQKASPNAIHGALAGELARILGNYLTETGAGRAFAEMRHYSEELNRAYLPDVSVVLEPRAGEAMRQRVVGWPPDVAIEILSPDDRAMAIVDKVEMYQALKVPLTLLVDPEERTIREYRPGQAARVYQEGDTLDFAPVLPGFVLDVAGLFGILPAEDRAGQGS